MTRLARVRAPDGVITGVVRGGIVHPIDVADTAELIAAGAESLEWAATQVAGVPFAPEDLLAPVVPVRNVFCVGWNYLAHFAEGRASRPEIELPQHPTFFTKATTTVNDPYGDVPAHAGLTDELDWEVELAVVIGRGGADIPEGSALSHVFGYTVANDITARDVQARHGRQWFRGKSLDGSLPLGPHLVTADEIDDPQQLAIECRVNGEVVQRASTRQMIFSVARIIAELSAGLTLLPGDIILTGTPEGVGHQRTPARHLRDGDTVSSTVERVGDIFNRIKA